MNKPFAQSGVVPFLRKSGDLKVVLITSRASGRWGIPKGTIEKNLSPQASALKEAIEEAGVIGQVSTDLLTQYQYEKWNKAYSVQVFTLEVFDVLEKWDEMKQRERAIVNVESAIELVKPELKPVLIKFQQLYCVR